MGAANAAREPMNQYQPSADDTPDRIGEQACYVLGDSHLGTAVARRLRSDGYTVSLVDDLIDPAGTPRPGEGAANPRQLREAGVGEASTVVVATRSDSRNLLIAQLVRAHFDVSEVVVLANAPDRLEVFAEAGHDPVCATAALSDALAENL
jgi:trk system potassium uptake protein TrkA